MKSQHFILLLVLVTQALAIQNNICHFHPPQADKYLAGCAENKCKPFTTMSDAEEACANDKECHGITLSGDGATYTTRAGKDYKDSPSGETSFLLDYCESDEDLQKDVDIYCYARAHEQQYLPGCSSDNCEIYKKFADAEAACNNSNPDDCQGITRSGEGTFTTRAGKDLKPSPSNETSFLRYECDHMAEDVEQVNECYNKEYKNQYLGGCTSDQCTQYLTIEDAIAKCDEQDECNGVTMSNQGTFTTREGDELKPSPSQEISYKKYDCFKEKDVFECYINEYEDTYLAGCTSDKCKEYEDLYEAIEICDGLEVCAGITQQPSGKYQTRANPDLHKSPTGERSYLRDDCVDFRLEYYPSCYTTLYEDQYLPGCTENKCKQFDKFNDAAEDCDKDPDCAGITQSQDGTYTTRAQDSLSQSPSGETSFRKVDCEEPLPSPGDIEIICYFTPFYDQYLAGHTSDNGQKFKDQQSAQTACDNIPECSGITLNTQDHTFTTRKGNELKPSPTNEISYMANDCAEVPKKPKDSDENGSSGDIETICYDTPHYDQYLAGHTSDNGQKFKDQYQAQIACDNISECSGITLNTQDNTFTTRKGKELKPSPTNEISYLASECTEVHKPVDAGENGASGEMDTVCYNTPHIDQYLGGYTSDNGQKFKDQQSAQIACDNIPECNGITYNTKDDVFTTRKGKELKPSPSNEISYLAKDCVQVPKPIDTGAPAIPPKPLDAGKTGASGEMETVCYYTPHYDKYLAGYTSDQGQKFDDIKQAENACDNIPECGGITFSTQDNTFTTRKGNELKPSPSYEISYLADDCVQVPKPLDASETGAPVPPPQPLDAGETGAPVPPPQPLDAGETGAPVPPPQPLDAGETGAPVPPPQPLDAGETGAPVNPPQPLDAGETGAPVNPPQPLDAGETGAPVNPPQPLDAGETGAPVNPPQPLDAGETGAQVPSNKNDLPKPELKDSESESEPEEQLFCYTHKYEDAVLAGKTSDGGKHYPDFDSAVAACDSLKECNGIQEDTDGTYETRKADTPQKFTGTNVYLKKDCIAAPVIEEEPQTGGDGSLPPVDSLFYHGECYAISYENSYLAGCTSDGCQAYNTFDEAALACEAQPECQGILQDENLVFNTRSESEIKESHLNEFVYLKYDCATQLINEGLLECYVNGYAQEVLESCTSDNCQIYDKWEDAADACNVQPECVGITESPEKTYVTGSGKYVPIEKDEQKGETHTFYKDDCKLADKSSEEIKVELCYIIEHVNTYLGGYTSDVGKEYHNFEDATSACNVIPECRGITEEKDGVYTTRVGQDLKPSLTGEVSYRRSDCELITIENPEEYVKPKQGFACYTEAYTDQYLPGCTSDECQGYETFQEAVIACQSQAPDECSGITKQGDYFQTRHGNKLSASPSQEVSYLRSDCVCQDPPVFF